MIDFDALVLAPNFDVFGEQVTYVDGARHQTELVGVFDEKWTETVLDHESGLPIATSRPMVAVRASQIGPGRPSLGELFVIRGRFWRVSDPPAFDGKGHIRVPLGLATDGDKARVPTAPVPLP